MNKVVRFHQTGGADVLQIDEVKEQEPEAGEVKLKVQAIGVNRSDVMFRMGQYLEQPNLPSKLGYEASGIVEAIGPGVTTVQVGDEVSTIPSFSMSQYGVYGDSAIVPEHGLGYLPEHLSPEERASTWMAYLTAYGALVDVGKLNGSEQVVITAASSSVGIAAIQIAKMQGATVIAVTRNEEKLDFLVSVGADHVIASRKQNLVEKIQAITQERGADLIFDPIAGPLLGELAQAAGMEAMIIAYGALAEDPTGFPLFEVLAKRLRIRGYTLFEITGDPDRLQKGKDYLYQALEKRLIRPVIDKVFDLSSIASAHEYMESNFQKGKIVVKVNRVEKTNGQS